MPITGYFGTGVNTEFFFLFDIPKFESMQLFQSLIHDGMGISFEDYEKPLSYLA